MTISRDDSRFWDVRTIERKIRQGTLSKKDVDKHLKGLPDVADKAQAFDLNALDDDEDDFDDELEDLEEEERNAAPPATGETASDEDAEGDDDDDADLDDEEDDDDEA